MIRPTIGRVVLVHERRGSADPECPEPAFVCYVHNDRSINVAGFNAVGKPFQLVHLPLVQGDETKPVKGEHAAWMPYQKQVAAGAIPAVLHQEAGKASDYITQRAETAHALASHSPAPASEALPVQVTEGAEGGESPQV